MQEYLVVQIRHDLLNVLLNAIMRKMVVVVIVLAVVDVLCFFVVRIGLIDVAVLFLRSLIFVGEVDFVFSDFVWEFLVIRQVSCLEFVVV